MKKKICSSVILFCFLLSLPCFAQDDVVRLKAPEELAELWQELKVKYVMYVHKEAHIKTFNNIDGMVLMVAVIDSKEILGDAKKVLMKSGLKRKIHIQNNPKFYDKQFLQMPDSIGMMVKSVAVHYKFDKNTKIVRLEFD